MVYLFGVLFFLTIILISQTANIHKNKAQRFETYTTILEREALVSYAREIARGHIATRGKGGVDYLLARMNENYRYISATYLRLGETNEKARGEAEWLLDNFYIIEEQTKGIRQNIQKKHFACLQIGRAHV